MSQFQFRKFDVIPPVIKNLLIANAIVWFAQITIGERFQLIDRFALHDFRSEYFQVHQLITHMFMHGGMSHLLFNMLALWMFGSTLENIWGPKRFLIFYIVSGLGAAGFHLAVLWHQNTELLNAAASGQFTPYIGRLGFDSVGEFVAAKLNEPTVGASGAVFGCLAGFAYLFPNTMIYLYFLFPIKAKWFVLGYAAIELYFGVQASAGDNVAHFAHLGGALVGFLLVYYWNKKNRQFY